MYCVVPMSTPSDVKSTDDVKIGEVTVFCVTVFPFESTCAGSKLAPFEITIFTGMMTVGIVAEPLGNGGTPTMLYLYVVPLKVNDPFQVCRGVVAARIFASACVWGACN